MTHRAMPGHAPEPATWPIDARSVRRRAPLPRARTRARLKARLWRPTRRGEQHHSGPASAGFSAGPCCRFLACGGHLHLGAGLRPLRPASHAMRPRVSDAYSSLVTHRHCAYSCSWCRGETALPPHRTCDGIPPQCWRIRLMARSSCVFTSALSVAPPAGQATEPAEGHVLAHGSEPAEGTSLLTSGRTTPRLDAPAPPARGERDLSRTTRCGT